MYYSRNLYLFTDNGQRVKLNINLDEWNKIKDRPMKDCLPTDLVECDVSRGGLDCFDCNQSFSQCVHFSNDETIFNDKNAIVTKIKKNKDANTGYCLKVTDKGQRTCTSKNGGKWILAQDNDALISYVCQCTSQHIFDNETKYGDCTKVNACKNGTIKDGWSSLSTIECECNVDYVPAKIGQYPACVKDSYFKIKPAETTEAPDEFLNPIYRGLKLPNPCNFDYLSKSFKPGAAVLAIENNVAYCKLIDRDNFTTIRFTDDYLLNNGGNFANGIISTTFIATTTSFDDVFETVAKDASGKSIGVLRGKAIPIRKFTLTDKFPYLDRNSGNMGGTGTLYTSAAIIKNPINAHIYVYEEITPIPVKLTLGNYVDYRPVFVSGFEATNRHFSGNIEFISPPLLNCGVFEIINLHKKFGNWAFPEFNIDGIVHVGKQNLEDASLVEKYVPPIFCNQNGIIVDNQFTKIFTGIYRNTIVDDIMWTHVVSPGKVLVQKMRGKIEGWSPQKIKSFQYKNGSYYGFATGDQGAGLVSDGYDTDEVANPPKEFTPYTATVYTFKWPTSH